MINPFLAARLQPVVRRHRLRRLALGMALWWTLATVAGWALFLRGAPPPLATEFLPDWVMISLLGAGLIWVLWYLMPMGFRGMARRIEKRFPALDGRLLTAVQVDQEGENDQPAFIRERLLSQTMQHSVDHDWNKAVGPLGGTAGQTAALLAVLAFAWVAGCVAMLRWGGKPGDSRMAEVVSVPEESVKLADGVEVTPGDAVLEKGSNLVVLVRFSQAVPENVSLVAGGGAAPARTVPLARSLKDPVFGGSLPGVREDFRYHIDYDGRGTREFTVKVFEYPRLEQSDVVLNFPEWTGLPEKRIEDTRRVSAVEGTKVSVTLKLNKPVVSAVLKPRGNGVEPLTLQTEADKPVAVLTRYILATSGTYELILTDKEGRTGKVPPVFTFEALPNSPPEVKLAQPRGDQTPSALEEMVFNGTARDDFGLLAWGLAFSQGGGEPEYVELGKEAPGGAARDFSHLLRLEEKGVKTNDLVSWFVWADDIGPDGKRRRTEGDLFFGEVRPFEQVFRRGQDQEGGGQQGGGGQGGGPGAKLAELQKQIINATWKLKRSPSPKKDDIGVVRDSQKGALAQAEEASSETRDRIMKAGWQKAKALMNQAVTALEESVDKPTGLSGALTAEQAAYQALLKLQEREFQVSRSQSSSSSQSQADQRMQEQLNEMELTEEKNRYEKEREAQAAEESERREDRQVINRLQELAKRQEEVNERLKELQTSLQAAETEEQREALQRELKRLEDEQRELLADVDELNQRMERPENRSRMAEERKQLEQARENARQASEQASQGNADQALSSGTRAQRQLQEMREDMRTKTSSGFEQDLRQMRSQARELASEQRKVNEQLKSMDESGGPGLGGDPARDEALKTLAEQKRRSEELTKKAAEISESAESAEPLVSRQLYDSMRKYAQDDAAGVKQAQEEMLQSGQISRQMYRRIQEMQNRQEGAKTLDLTSDLLQEDFVDQARSTGQYAQAGIEDFKKGIEKAAESVVGDDTEALKRADSELESLTRELEKEIAEASGGRGSGQPGNDPGSENPDGNDSRTAGQLGQENREGGEDGVASTGQQGRPNAAGQEGNGSAGKGKPNEQGETGASPQSGERNDSNQQLAQANSRDGQKGQEPGADQEGDSETGDQPPGGGAGRQEGNQGQGRQGQEQGQGQEPGESRQDNQGQGQGQQGEQPGQGQQGEQPGQGQQNQGQGPSQQGQDQNQSQPGEGQGQGQNESQQSGASQRPGQQQGQGQGDGQGQGQEGGNENSQGGESPSPSGNDPSGRGGRSGGGARAAGGSRGGYTRPLGGEGYNEWSDSLRDVQELVEFPDLQNRIADVRETARQMRVEAKRDLKKPDWAVVKSDVLTPLVEVRKSVREELLRRRSGEALVPIDRDPVPGRYSEQVRNYYEKLGKD